MMDSKFEPVGQYYHAISPDESLTSAHELTEARFKNLFECVSVDSLDKLLSPDNAPAAPPVPDGWVQRVEAALLDTESSEDHMNGILQNALTEADGLHGLRVDAEETGKTKQRKETLQGKKKGEKFFNIKFGSPRKKSSKKQNMEVVRLLKVKERQIRNLFSDCYGDDSYNNVERQNGLPISLKSRPDFAAWAAHTGGMLMTCEGKNKNNFELFHAIRQCSAYMLVHLFFWLVTKSKVVQSVYGIAVAGTNCKGMRGGDSADSFAVVLLRLSLPTKIGGKLRLEQYKIAPGSSRSLEQLWTFTNGVCKMCPLESADLLYGQGCPALLQMPSEILGAEPNPDQWAMIKNGTANLILRINSQEGWKYIGQCLEDGTFEYFEQSLTNDLGDERGYPLYFKSKTFLATDNPGNLDFYLIANRQRTPGFIDLQEAYKVPPLRTGTGLYILMPNMGDPFCSSDSCHQDLWNLASKFLPFMKRVLDCQKDSKLVHGDIHAGNLLYDGNMLHLIDYDEARTSFVTARQPQTDNQRRVYNERLTEDVDQFTKNQLINLFQECLDSFGLDTTGTAPDSITGLMEEYRTAFKDGQSPDAVAVDIIYDRLYEALQEILSEALIPVTP